MTNYSQIATLRDAFATIKTPISASGMMRYGRDVDGVFNDILNGAGRRGTLNRTLFTTATALTISGGVVTSTLAQHTITSQTGTTDDLDTITASNNTFLMLRATAGHTITLRNGMGNIAIRGGANVVLTGNRSALLWCADGQWSVIGVNQPLNNGSATRDPGSTDDGNAGYSVGSMWVNTTLERVWECVDSTAGTAFWRPITPWNNWFAIRTSGNGLNPSGIGATILQVGSNYSSAPIDNNDGFANFNTGSVSGDANGFRANVYNLVRPQYNPVLDFMLQTSVDITNYRIWVGFSSAAINNSDTLAAGTKFVGFRFSTIAGDAGWTPVNNDGTTQAAGATIGTVAVSTIYRLRIRVDAANNQAFFSVNNGAEQALSTNFPALSTDMEAVVWLFTLTNAIRTIRGAWCEVGW